MNKFLLPILLLPILLFSQGTPRSGGINNAIAPVIIGAIHDNFVGVQHTNSNAFGVYSYSTSFDYNLGLKSTDNLAEGSTNKYFSNTLARNAFSNGFGLDYSAGVYSLNSTTQGILSSVANKFNNPTGLITQYIRGDGSLASFPTIPIIKRQETYSGTTNASGIYTVTFTTSYSVTPNIQANIIGGTPNQFITMTRSTTGFTCTVYQRNTVNLLSTELLLGTTVLVNGATVDVLITER